MYVTPHVLNLTSSGSRGVITDPERMYHMQIRIKKLSETAVIPTKGTPGSAGYDLYACIGAAVSINPGETTMVGTGLALEIPTGYVGLIYARSGLATDKGLAPANKVGVCDSDYRGEYKIPLYNHGSHPALVLPGERIAQLVITPHLDVTFLQADELTKTSRADGGFGSTNS